PAGSPLPHAGAVSAVAFSPDGSRLLTGAEQTTRLWSLPAPEGIALHAPGMGWVRSSAFSPDGKTLLTADGEPGERGAGRVWDAATGKLLGTPVEHKDFILATAFSPDNRTIATAGAEGTVRLADALTGRAGPVLHHAGAVYVVAFSPAGDLVLTGSD